MIKWAVLLLILWLLRPVFFLTYIYFSDPSSKAGTSQINYVNDASKLNNTKIDSLVLIEKGKVKAIAQLLFRPH